jgi:hypothetical protein
MLNLHDSRVFCVEKFFKLRAHSTETSSSRNWGEYYLPLSNLLRGLARAAGERNSGHEAVPNDITVFLLCYFVRFQFTRTKSLVAIISANFADSHNGFLSHSGRGQSPRLGFLLSDSDFAGAEILFVSI